MKYYKNRAPPIKQTHQNGETGVGVIAKQYDEPQRTEGASLPVRQRSDKTSRKRSERPK